ncbi:MAG: hypothetical protein GY773_15720 [Actinomycetia bacterium]|nr:hypothetical protein [Actinomycetes bacterium]
MRSGRKELYTELGQHVDAKSTEDNGDGHDSDIERIILELGALDAAEQPESSTEDEAAV